MKLPKTHLLFLKIYGINIKVETTSIELLKRIQNDFSIFISEELSHYDFLFKEQKDLSIPKSPATYHWKGTPLYHQKKGLYIDYSEAILFADFKTNIYFFCGSNIHRVHEILYLAILSRVGKKMDLNGLHKLHAFAAKIHKNIAVGIGSSGVGKSTLALSLLKENAELISDDIPLFSSRAIYPLPLRVSTTLDCPDENYDYLFKRKQYPPKKLFDAKKYKVAELTPHYNFIFFILKRNNKNEEPSILKCSKIFLFFYLFKFLVIGVGTPMVMELFWEPGVTDFFVKTQIFFKRLKSAFCLTLNTPAYVLNLSKNKQKNTDLITCFLKTLPQ